MTGITYVVTHQDLRAIKVGCTSARSNRLEYLERRGWTPYRHLAVETTRLARQIEQATLFELRFRLHVPPYLKVDQLPNGGWTETASAALIGAPEVWEIVCEQAGLAQLNPDVGRGMRQPPAHRRQRGDTPRYVAAARSEAARTARAAQLAAPNQPRPKHAANEEQK